MKNQRAAALGITLAMTGLSIAAGCVTGTGMEGTFYLLLPYAVGLVLDLLLLSGTVRITFSGEKQRTGGDEKRLRRFPYEAGGRALLGAAGLLGAGITALMGNYQGTGAGAALYILSQAAGAFGGLALLRSSRAFIN